MQEPPVRGKVLSVIRDVVQPWHARSEAWLLSRLRCLPQRHYGEIAADMQAAGGEVMLDMGGADGSASESLVHNFSSRVVIDISEGESPDVVADGVGKLPFADGTFSYVLSLEVLEHVREPAQFLAEAARVLAPGGRLCLSTRQYFRTHGWPDDYFRYTREGLQHVFSDSGLTIERMIPLGGPFTVMATAWDQLCGQAGLARPVLKQIFCYPFHMFAIWMDGIVMRSEFFQREPDTTGWLVFAVRR